MKKLLTNLIIKCRKNKAFTLIEMVLVLFIVAALLLLIIPNMTEQANNAKAKTDKALVETVEAQKNLYLLENDGLQSVTAEKLANDGYITQDQLNQYNAIKK
ncbi:competence type IV pilus major pilin ComGC [Aerococcus urinaeequi]|uniref:Prepilin-type N-terminal cleavage/methylation domain-containing protein n=1 Tax=Aerococcus viridans TaxID=1377 RepID=A0A2N6UEM4_9LACT|nr:MULTISPECIES: competence type IV pilus major pilin ComGC [Aerococcus]OFU48795.1 competence protein ComG [Aerococcus sp. HMSC10H05]PMC79995.1 prepilin-type N-terminal cleavage/methylation domain-containing protein [Aerococcus viridans]